LKGALGLLLIGVPALDPVNAATLNVPSVYGNIQAAIDAAEDGDIVIVGPGTYTQSLTFGSKQIALRSSDGPANTIINAAGGTGISLGNHSELNGFTITGSKSQVGAAVRVNGLGTLIKGNVFDGNTQASGGFGAAIGGNGASAIIDGNVFRNNKADSQHLSGVVSFINGSSPQIINNVFEDNQARALTLTLPSGGHPVVSNNTFIRNPVAIKYGSFSSTTFTNNILDGNGTGFLLDYPYQQPIWQANLVHNNGTDYAGGMPNLTGIAGNLSVDPLFISSSNPRLQPGSPAFNSGVSLGAPDHDLDGNLRPFAGAVDMGAFELIPEPSSFALAIGGATILVYLARRTHGRSIVPTKENSAII
jgi:hypothetical protein